MRSQQWMGLLGAVWALNRMQVGAVAAPPVGLTPREKALVSVQAFDAARLKQYGGQDNFMVRPGLLADKTGRIVRVSAESLRLEPGSPAEFPLVTATSGKDYEAHAVAFAAALDIHNALQFIGLKPGHGVDAGALQFWPRGDRVAVTFHYQDPTLTNQVHIPAARLTIDTRTGKTLPENGFVFTGSEWTEVTEPVTGRVYAADAFTPGCIVSHYNERTTVLDVPRRDAQSEVYSYQVPNPALRLPSNQVIEVTFEPYFKDGRAHDFDFVLTVGPGSGSNTADLAYTLQDAAGQPVNTNRTLSGVLDVLEGFSGIDQAAYLTFHPEESLTMVSLQKVARLLDKLDSEHGVRVDAPPPGHPYFRAFLPNEQHRKREARPALAAELILENGATGATGTLVLVSMEWKGDDSTPTFSETRLPVPTAAQLIPALTSKEDVPGVILAFVPPSMRYGAFREFVAPLLQRKTILYVFIEP